MNKSYSLILVLLLSIALAALYGCDAGRVCTQRVNVPSAGSGTVYYPCSGGPYPATTLTSGFLGTKNEVAWLARAIAQGGFVALAITPTNPYGMVSGWREAHKGGIRKLRDLANGSLRGKIDTSKLQTCGHSKGGGGSLWASSQLGSELSSTIGMAPWQEEFITLAGIRSPTLIQAGLLDTLATAVMTMNEFAILPNNIPRAYFQYTAADHMSWTSLGLVHPILSSDVVAWMKYYLKGDTSQRAKLNSLLNKSVNTWINR